ncbi:hypothetical protein HGRIS_008265 [Hohenbuehelia grisea]|uniref:Thioredoxin domain-containing protein n=1 Tax=Hohenbuehelia grisea TaxID=104357 RepID=A0ABR3J7V9_9AGAR
MSITHLTTVDQLNKVLSKKDKLTVIDFHATWCGPCHAIAPTFEALSKRYSNVNFCKCDVDAAKEIASMYAVSAMPTFIFLKGTTKVDQVRGADRAALESAVARHATSSSSSAFSGKGQTLGGDPAPTDIRRDVNAAVDGASAAVGKLDPQLKVLLGLLAAYAVFWYLS